jgi:hypothetical protein
MGELSGFAVVALAVCGLLVIFFQLFSSLEAAEDDSSKGSERAESDSFVFADADSSVLTTAASLYVSKYFAATKVFENPGTSPEGGTASAFSCFDLKKRDAT